MNSQCKADLQELIQLGESFEKKADLYIKNIDIDNEKLKQEIEYAFWEMHRTINDIRIMRRDYASIL